MLQAKTQPITLDLVLNKEDMYLFFSLYLKTIQGRSGYAYATRAIAQHLLNSPQCVELHLDNKEVELVLTPNQVFFSLTWPFLYSRAPKVALRGFFKRLKANYSTLAQAKLTILLNQTEEGLCKSK